MQAAMPLYDFSHWPALPKVSCQCLTFGRPELLVEAVECFIRQDYPGPKELIVLNDQPGVEYFFETDGLDIQAVNLPVRCATVGGKRNLCAAHSSGEIIMPWDDDDIHLPWRISVTVQEMKNRHYFKAKRFWFSCPPKFRLEKPGGGAPSMGAWSRELFERVGRYPEVQSGQDTEFQNRIRATARDLLDIRYLPDEAVYYIYRWGTGHYHLSGYGRGQKGFDVIGQRARAHMVPGRYVLTPVWREDYVEKVREELKRRRAA